jgi:hypothetical protein
MRLKDNTMQLALHIPYPALLHLLHGIIQFFLDSVHVCATMLHSCVIPKSVHYIQMCFSSKLHTSIRHYEIW